MILTNENLFLIVIGIVWIVGAVMQDLRRREVDNIWNFSLIGFALAYRFAVSVYGGNYWFFYNGLIGFGIFLILGNLFYYGRMFAGGDTKLMIALGVVLPLSYSWLANIKIFGVFIGGFLVGGSLYVFVWALVLSLVNIKVFSKEFGKQYSKYRTLFLISFGIALIFVIGSYFLEVRLVLLGLVIILFPILFIFSKSVEEVCMIKKVDVDKLTEGDWLYEDIYVKGKKIEKNWQGVTAEELKLIQKKYDRKILVKYGVPFTPSFLVGFVIVLWISSRLGWF